MKKIAVFILCLMMTVGMFATDLKKITTVENEEIGTIDVYFDYDEREPFYIKTESIEYFLILKDIYEEVEVIFIKEEEMDEDCKFVRDLAVENNCYYIFMECENWYDVVLKINIDGSVTAYCYR